MDNVDFIMLILIGTLVLVLLLLFIGIFIYKIPSRFLKWMVGLFGYRKYSTHNHSQTLHRQEYAYNDNNELWEAKKTIKNLKIELDNKKRKIDQLERQIKDLTKNPVQCSNNRLDHGVDIKLEIIQNDGKSNEKESSSMPIYVKNFNNGILRECSHAQSSFKIEPDASFSKGQLFYNETCEKAKKLTSELFDDVYDVRGDIIHATSFDIVPGEVIKQDIDWKVIKRGVITFK